MIGTKGDALEGGSGAPVGLAIALALTVGKTLGITVASWLIVVSGRSELPPGVNWMHILGVSLLGGIGFTMSIFIGELAFTDASIINEAKLGILIGSIVSGVLGYLILHLTLPKAA